MVVVNVGHQRAKDHPEEEKKEAPKPALSIVDIASASINGRSAAAALAGSAAKTAAHVAAHTAGSLAPVNSRLVNAHTVATIGLVFLFLSYFRQVSIFVVFKFHLGAKQTIIFIVDAIPLTFSVGASLLCVLHRCFIIWKLVVWKQYLNLLCYLSFSCV